MGRRPCMWLAQLVHLLPFGPVAGAAWEVEWPDVKTFQYYLLNNHLSKAEISVCKMFVQFESI